MEDNSRRQYIFNQVMNRKDTKKLIKEYVSEILKEYDDGSMGIDTGGYGAVYGGKGDLFNTFIKPFTDVIGTAIGKTKEVMRRGLTVLNVAFETLMTTLVPFLTDSYDEIFAKEKSDLQKIRSEYKQYYDSTAAALGSGDAKMLAFIAFPGATLTGKFIKDAPDVAKGILSVATGGLTDQYLGSSAPSSSGKGKKSPFDVFDSYVRSYEKLLSEGEEETSLADKAGSKKFVDSVLRKSPIVQAAARDAQQIYRSTLAQRIEPVEAILAAKTIEELGKVLGKKIEEPNYDELDPEQKLSAVQKQNAFLDSVRKTSIEAALKELNDYVAPVRAIFGSEHPFVRSYDEVIAAVKAGNANKLEQIKKQLGLSA